VLTRRIVPCLDVQDGRVVKGIQFLALRDAGDPVEQAARYDAEGADEICFLDISASPEGRSTILDVVARTADRVFVPLTVGGGVRTVDDAERLLLAGADKIAKTRRDPVAGADPACTPLPVPDPGARVAVARASSARAAGGGSHGSLTPEAWCAWFRRAPTSAPANPGPAWTAAPRRVRPREVRTPSSAALAAPMSRRGGAGRSSISQPGWKPVPTRCRGEQPTSAKTNAAASAHLHRQLFPPFHSAADQRPRVQHGRRARV
jgi:hypothetical protein